MTYCICMGYSQNQGALGCPDTLGTPWDSPDVPLKHWGTTGYSGVPQGALGYRVTLGHPRVPLGNSRVPRGSPGYPRGTPRVHRDPSPRSPQLPPRWIKSAPCASPSCPRWVKSAPCVGPRPSLAASKMGQECPLWGLGPL